MRTTKRCIYNEEAVRSNIEEVLDQATSQIYKDAKEWYPKAHQYAVDFSNEFGKSEVITSAIIACLSPQKEWYHNLELTRDFLRSQGRSVRHVLLQKHKAKGIYNIRATKEEDIINSCKHYLGGLKTQNFFMNIYEPTNKDHITIDSHMCQLVSGDMTYKDPTSNQYAQIKQVLLKIAGEKGMLPTEFQSLLWLTWKSIKPKRIVNEQDYF